MEQVLRQSRIQQQWLGDLIPPQPLLLFESAQQSLDLLLNHFAKFLQQLLAKDVDLGRCKHQPFHQYQSSGPVDSAHLEACSSFGGSQSQKFCR